MKKKGLVLSGGGSRGLAHLGALKVLDSWGVKFDAIAGCSMGALIGAFYAAGRSPVEIKEFFLTRELYEFLDYSIQGLSRVQTNKFKRAFEEFAGVNRFRDLKIPLYVNATNITRGKQVVFSKGGLFKAVRASVSVPGAFTPFKIKSDYYVDGGVLDQTPFNALPPDVNRFIIIDASRFTRRKNPINALLLLENSLHLMQNELTRLRLDKLDEANYALVKPRVGKYHLVENMSKAKALIREGELATRKRKRELKDKGFLD